MFDLSGKRIYVAGHGGMVGAALCRRLGSEPCEILTANRAALDLEDRAATEAWVRRARPDVVVVAAAKVGGIAANSAHPVEFLVSNLRIELNLIGAAYAAGVRKLLFLGSSCIYPKAAPQPITEDMLLTGPLEPTNEAYALAKIVGMKLAQFYRRQYGADFISLMPTNLYGPGDNYDLESSHVPAALIRRFHEAKRSGAASVAVWGSGRPRREFLHVDDLADACVFVLQNYSDEQFLNVGSGEEASIAEFARLVSDVVGYRGRIDYDTSRPDGMERKLLDSSRLAKLGWRARTPLRDGLSSTYAAYLHADSTSSTAGDPAGPRSPVPVSR
jgi:GDP-L-fucose synthase